MLQTVMNNYTFTREEMKTHTDIRTDAGMASIGGSGNSWGWSLGDSDGRADSYEEALAEVESLFNFKVGDWVTYTDADFMPHEGWVTEIDRSKGWVKMHIEFSDDEEGWADASDCIKLL